MRALSIKARLMLLMLGAMLAVELVTGWITYRRAIHEMDELLDTQLVQYAQIVLSLGRDGHDGEVRLPDIEAHPYQNQLMFQIWDVRGEPHLVLRSPEAPAGWPGGVAASGFSETVLAGHAWRFFAVRSDGYRVLAAHDLHIHQELASQIALSNMAPFFVAVPVLALLLGLAVRQGLAPTHALARALAARDPRTLDALAEADWPSELRPPVAAMNQLFGRIRHTLDEERRFTSDASHELRTPIAALRAQLQVAERTPDAQECRAAIGKALHGTRRMTHLVDQLLALARLDAESVARPDAAVNLDELLRDVAEGLSAQAADKRVSLRVARGTGGVVTGNAELLRILLRNLVDNAVRYGADGGRVEAGVQRDGTQVVVSIRDDGPGVAVAARDRLGERFHRIGTPRAEGVGLGLSIVRRVAELHGAEIAFGDGLDGCGLSVTVAFPVAV